MKRISLGIALILGTLSMMAQDNDTALLHKLGVREVQKHVYIHAFQNKRDTCLYFTQELDSLARPLRETVNMGCYGYSTNEIYSYSYQGDHLYQIKVERDGEPFTLSTYRFVGPGQPSYIKTFFYQTNDSTESFFEYFMGDHEQPDSNTMLEIDQNGDSTWSLTVARFDELGRVQEVITLDSNRIAMQEVAYELLGDGKPASVATSIYGERPMFIQNYYEYSDDGILAKSYNSRNQTQIFYYHDNGLISNIMNYNPKGELESEVIYKYLY